MAYIPLDRRVEELLTCSICLARFNNPRVLPCQHTFCETPCLEGLIDKRNSKVRCPECRKEHTVPLSGVGRFPTNITITNLLDLPTKRGHSGQGHSSNRQEAVTAGTSNRCGVCEHEETTVKCFHCNKLVCESCKQSHTKQLKLDIRYLLKQIRKAVSETSNRITAEEQRIKQIKQKYELGIAAIQKIIDKYVRELRQRQSEFDAVQHGELRPLELQLEEIEVEVASILSFCDSNERLINDTLSVIPQQDIINIKRECVEYMVLLRHT